MVQSYSGFGSSYLAGFGFLGLALPDDHPVWTAEAEPPPTSRGDHQLCLPDLGWVINNTGDLSRLTNHGTDHCSSPVEDRSDPDDPHYAKFSYSSHTAPGIGAAFDDGVDGHIALVDGDGRATRRGPLRGSRVDGPISGSVQIPQRDRRPVLGSAVITVSIDHGPDELRCHLIIGAAGHTVREGGHLIAGATDPGSGIEPDGTVWVRGDDALGSVTPIRGWQSSTIRGYTDDNAMGRHAAVGVLTATGEDRQVLIALHTLTRSAEFSSVRDRVRVEVDGSQVTAHWSDEPNPVRVDLATFVHNWDGHLGGRRGRA